MRKAYFHEIVVAEPVEHSGYPKCPLPAGAALRVPKDCADRYKKVNGAQYRGKDCELCHKLRRETLQKTVKRAQNKKHHDDAIYTRVVLPFMFKSLPS